MNISRVAEKQVILQLMNNILFNAQRIYYYIIPPMEFNKIKTAKGSCILILIASCNLQILPLYLIGQVCQTIAVHFHALPPGHSNQKRHHHRRRSTQARSGRSITLQINLTAPVNLHSLQSCLYQIQLAVINKIFSGIVLYRHIKIQRMNNNLIILPGNN